jgi:probable rRNA maturation factor
VRDEGGQPLAVSHAQDSIVSISIQITNRQKSLPIDRRRLRAAVMAVLRDAAVSAAEISVAVVDDPTIAALHDRYLDDPTPTDVLSFVLERSEACLEGEVIVSAETARTCAAKYRSTAEDELLRYVIHGVLHLVGYDDATPPQRAAMRTKERKYLREVCSPPADLS